MKVWVVICPGWRKELTWLGLLADGMRSVHRGKWQLSSSCWLIAQELPCVKVGIQEDIHWKQSDRSGSPVKQHGHDCDLQSEQL